MRLIDRDTLKGLLDRGEPVMLVEAMSLPYYRKAHLPGARPMPPELVERLAASLLPDRHARIVVYCADVDCMASHEVAHMLEAHLGYDNVFVYPGGKQDWADGGLPLERGLGAAGAEVEGHAP